VSTAALPRHSFESRVVVCGVIGSRLSHTHPSALALRRRRVHGASSVQQVDVNPDLSLPEDPFDVAAGDMESVARRYEQHLYQVGAEEALDRARAEIAAGETIPLADLADH
jgi:hypothetical protein